MIWTKPRQSREFPFPRVRRRISRRSKPSNASTQEENRDEVLGHIEEQQRQRKLADFNLRSRISGTFWPSVYPVLLASEDSTHPSYIIYEEGLTYKPLKHPMSDMQCLSLLHALPQSRRSIRFPLKDVETTALSRSPNQRWR